VSEKFDFRKLMLEIVEDEKTSKARPVLLTQKEITLLLQKRSEKQTGGNQS